MNNYIHDDSYTIGKFKFDKSIPFSQQLKTRNDREPDIFISCLIVLILHAFNECMPETPITDEVLKIYVAMLMDRFPSLYDIDASAARLFSENKSEQLNEAHDIISCITTYV